ACSGELRPGERGDHGVGDESVERGADDGDLPAAWTAGPFDAHIPFDSFSGSALAIHRPERPAAQSAPGDPGEQTRSRPSRPCRALQAGFDVAPFVGVEDRLPVALRGDFVAFVGADAREARVAEHGADCGRRPSVLRALRRWEALVVPAAG